MNRIKIPVIFSLCILTLLTCGLDELLYLPPVPESNITTEKTSKATVYLPSLSSISYATGYIIYYKIYIINTVYDTVPELINRNSRISSDYNYLKPYTDTTNTSSSSSIPSLNTFRNRGFYELELENSKIGETVLSKSGGTFTIQFPLADGITNKPYINSSDNPIYRSTDGGAFNPKPTGAGFRYFFSSADLNNYDYSSEKSPTVNADVSGQSGLSEKDFAYTSMYIVPVGTQQDKGNFSRLYGKPTHISIFKLPKQ